MWQQVITFLRQACLLLQVWTLTIVDISIMEPFQSCFNVQANDPRLLRVSRCQGKCSDRHCMLEKYIVEKPGSCNRTRISVSEVAPGKFFITIHQVVG